MGADSCPGRSFCGLRIADRQSRHPLGVFAMRIVDRATFLALPAGTVYAKWSPLEFGELAIKCGTCESGNDWVYQSLDMLEGDSPLDSLMDLDAGKEVAVDMDYTSRDGLYTEDIRFAVWSPEDVQALILRLEKAASDVRSAQ